MWLQDQEHVIKNYKQLTQNMHYIAKTNKVQKNKLTQANQGTLACYAKIKCQP